MPIALEQSRYGKSRVRLLKVARQPDRHDLKQLTVAVQFEGDFESSYLYGDNTRILPSDTMKNTVYAFAKLYSIEQIEDFARRLAEHFLTGQAQLSRVRVDIAEDFWTRLPHGGKPHATSFAAAGPERRTTAAIATRGGVSPGAAIIEAGIENLVLLRTAGAAFENYIHDPFTTVPEMPDRILAASLKAAWTYADTEEEIPYGPYWHGVRQALLETFIEHDSKSLQHTLYAMAEAALERYRDIADISISMLGRNCAAVDLEPFGLHNDNDIFAPSEDPEAVVEARLTREPTAPARLNRRRDDVSDR